MSKFALGAGSRKRLSGVHPFLIECVEHAITITPVDFAVHDGLRTEAQQRALVARGASRTMDSKHRPQPDSYGHAVDLVPWINGQLRWEWPPIYEIAAAMQKAVAHVNEQRLNRGGMAMRLRWGGVWDRGFETLGLTPGAIKASVNAYVDRRRAMGRSAFIDGPHFEIAR
jgi:peptidoglycan LD-endopeptidase CwlK